MIKPHPIKLPPATLYLDDLKTLDSLLTPYTTEISYTVTGKEFDTVYSSLDELITTSTTKSFSDFNISPKNFDLTIVLSSNATKIFYSDGEDYQMRGIVSHLQTILNQRTSCFAKWRVSWNFSMLFSILTMLILFRFFFPTLDWAVYLWYGFAGGLVLTSWIFFALNQIVKFSTVHLKNKQEYNIVDNILKNPTGLIGPVLGALIVFALGYFIGNK